MMLTPIGWIAVHALWQVTLIAGVTALVLGLLRNARAQSRYLASCIGLAAMIAALIATAATRAMPMTSRVRREVMPAVDSVVDLPTLIYWASMIVPIAGAVWLAGVGVWFIRMAIEFQRVRVLRRETRDAPRLPGEVDVRASTLVNVPMVLGWLEPLVLLPEQARQTLTDQQLRAVLAHEFAHVRRHDYAVNIAVVVAESLLFFHPAARWVASRIRMEREFCCDDAAIAAAGDTNVYARALAELEDARCGSPLAVAASSGTLYDRINRIVNGTKPTLTPGRGVLALITATFVAATLLTLSLSVPPGLPFGAVMKRRTPLPPGALVGPERLNGVDASGAPRRKKSREQGDAR
jgi:beta-lactamase regulating signal transducer with metallopeptidase domain